MKNITLSIDVKVLATVRRYAVDRDSSINGLVRDYLTSLAERHDRASQARRQLRKLSAHSRARTGTKSWTRADLHER
jgi:hypothetical protein